MAGLLTNANYINDTIKPAIKSAIEAQGVTVPSTDSFLDYADRIGEIEGGGSGYQLKDLPSGAISTVTDAAPLPLNALKVSVEAVQSGSGDPSPSNIRPIHGWSSANIFDAKKNLADNSNIVPIIGNSNNVYVAVTAPYGSIVVPIKGGRQYVISIKNAQTIFTSTSAEYPTAGGGMIDNYTGTGGQTVTTKVVNTSANARYLVFHTGNFDFEEAQVEIGNQATTYEPYQGKQYTLNFPSTIYGAEWDVVSGSLIKGTGYGLDLITVTADDLYQYTDADASAINRVTTKQLTGFNTAVMCNMYPIVSSAVKDESQIGIRYNTTNNRLYIYDMSITSMSDAESRFTTTPLQVLMIPTTPTTIDLSPLSVRMLQGVNNIYADCGEVLEGEYFIDEGAIDVRKVDYQIGSSGSIKTTDGRVLSGFASMSGYHARPLDASGNWLDVDWSKDFEIGVAFKFTALPSYQSIFGDGNVNSYRKAPRIYYDNSEGKLALCVSSDGSTLAIDTYLNHTFVADKWYFIKAKFVLSTMTFTVDISDDFSTFTSLYSGVMASAPYHDTASLSLGGEAQQSNMASNTFLIDTFNAYIKGDGVNWGASTGVFPS